MREKVDVDGGKGVIAERVAAGKARGDLKGTPNRVARGKERLIITRHDDEEVAVIPVEDLRLLERLKRDGPKTP